MYEPLIVKKQVGASVIESVEKRKGKLIKELGVSDRTLAEFEGSEEDVNEMIIHRGIYLEEVKEKVKAKTNEEVKETQENKN